MNDSCIVIEYTAHFEPKECKSATPINKTDKLMTVYEYTKLLGVRANQLKLGMPTTIKWTGKYDPILIAKEEISQGEIPLMIKRKVPDKKYEGGYRYEYWDIKDMDIRDC